MKYRYNMIQLLVMIVMAVFLFTCNASARSISLTIEDLFQQVEVDNTEIRIACNEREVAFMRERAEKDCWLPDIGLMLEEDYLGNAYRVCSINIIRTALRTGSHDVAGHDMLGVQIFLR